MSDHSEHPPRFHPPLDGDDPVAPAPGSGPVSSSGLSRRGFVGVGLAAGGAALLGGAAACEPLGRPREAGGRPDEEGGPEVPPFELDELSLAELQEGLEAGRWTSIRLTELYLQRIADLDRAGPELRAVIETNPEAPEIAAALDRERASGMVRGPLHGIPILLKDNIATHDRTTTTAGSLALEGSVPPADAHVVRRLREAGAVLLGKANLSEWANFRSSRSSSGWSARGGQCRNPYALDRNPCGSSSGSAVAAAASLCAAAVGTETNGSVVCPSNATGIVGLKPTVGLVSRTRIIPISHTQDTAGPMGRTVEDVARLLGGMTGPDRQDPATEAGRGRALADYTPHLRPEALRGARIAVARQYLGEHERVDALFEEALEAMAAAGATLVDVDEVEAWTEMGSHASTVLYYEFKADLNAYLEALGPDAPVHGLAEVIAFNEAHADVEMPYFRQERMERAQAKGPLTEPEYREALATARRLSRDEGIDRVVTEHRVDAIAAPTGGPAWTTDLINGDRFVLSSSSPAAISGYPNITVPMGFVYGLPVGLSLFGPAWSEPRLLELAYAYERTTGHRRPPRFLPTAEL